MKPRIEILRSRLEGEFRRLTHVGDVRQWGFMVGIQLVAERKGLKEYPPESRTAHRVILEARKRGVIVRPLGDVIILMPPLSITEGELNTLLDVVYESIRFVTEE